MPEYKIEAHSATQTPHIIVTSDKSRVFRYVAGLSAMSDYHRVTVTVDGKVFEGDQIRSDLP